MNYKYKVGDVVIYINPNGVNWGKRTIKALDSRAGRNTYYIEPTDTPWYSVGEECLHEIKEKKSINIKSLLKSGKYYIDAQGKDASFDRWRICLYYRRNFAETLFFQSEKEYDLFLNTHTNGFKDYSSFAEVIK